MITNEQIEKFISEAHRVGDAGLTICSSGNIFGYHLCQKRKLQYANLRQAKS